MSPEKDRETTLSRHQSASTGAEILRYVRVVKRRFRYVALPVVLVPCAAIIGLTFVGSVYESSSTVIYEEKLPFAREMGDIIVQKSETSYGDTGRLAQIEARLKSAIFLSEVVQRLRMTLPKGVVGRGEAAKAQGISPEEYNTRVLVDALRGRIKIAEMGQDLFKITVSDPDPGRAFRLTDGITKLFVEYVTKGQVADIKAVGTFSEDQLPVYEEKLRQSEEKLKAFRSQMAGRTSRSGTLDDKNAASARTVIDQTDAEIAELDAHRKTCKETMDATYPNAVNPVTLIRSGGINAAYAQLVKEEEADVPLLAQGVSRSSVMERVGLTRERLLSVIQEAVGSTLSGSPSGLLSLVSEQVYDDNVIRSLERRRTLLSGLVGQYSRAVGRRPEDEMELARLSQEVDANNSVLQSLRHQLTSSQISAAAQTTSLGVRIEVIEPATRPLSPAGPGRHKVLLLAFLLGPFMGICYVVLSEYMDDSVKSVEDVTKSLGIPVLGTIPKVPGPHFWQTAKTRRWPYVVILAALLLTVGVRIAHAPLTHLLGAGRQVIEVGDFSGANGRTLTGDEQTGNDKGTVRSR